MELDRASHRGLFPGMFHRHTPFAVIQDGQDGVLRCPRCTWELEDGTCGSCGWSDPSDIASTFSVNSEGSYPFDEEDYEGHDFYLDDAGAFVGHDLPGFHGPDRTFDPEDIQENIEQMLLRHDSALDTDSDEDGSVGKS